MIKIGDFARLTHVSVATLRHYDEIGLLKPISVDDVSGYRFYGAGQLPTVNRIVALKDLGFSLDQIHQLLQDGLTRDQLRDMLMRKQAEVRRQLSAVQGRLDRIEGQMKCLAQEDRLPEYDVALKTVPPMLVAAQCVTIPRNEEVPAYLGAAFTAVSSHINRHGAKATGACLAVWHQSAEVLTNEEVDAVVPIDRPIPDSDEVRVYTVPEARVVSAVHHHQAGADDFTLGHAAILSWIEASHQRSVGPYREVYINWEHGDAATEIQYPVEAAV